MLWTFTYRISKRTMSVCHFSQLVLSMITYDCTRRGACIQEKDRCDKKIFQQCYYFISFHYSCFQYFLLFFPIHTKAYEIRFFSTLSGICSLTRALPRSGSDGLPKSHHHNIPIWTFSASFEHPYISPIDSNPSPSLEVVHPIPFLHNSP